MNKCLAALAVLGTFSCTAGAQSGVTLYGLVDVGYYRLDPKKPGVASTNAVDSGIQSGSRLGLRGSEDLGGGLRAVFQLENGFNADRGTLGQGGLLFGRWAWAGLAGGFGEVRLGRQAAFGYEMFGEIDPFGTGFRDAGLQSTMTATNGIRLDNMVAYRSPAFGPVRFNVGYSAAIDGQEGNSSEDKVFTIGARGAVGPMVLVATYDEFNDPADRPSQKIFQLGAVLDLTVVSIHAAIATEKDFSGVEGWLGSFTDPLPNSAGADAGKRNKAKSHSIGLTVPVGGGQLLAQYQYRDLNIEYLDAEPDLSVQDHRTIAIGYTYPLSRRTNLYAYMADTDQKKVQSLIDRREFAIGLRHTF